MKSRYLIRLDDACPMMDSEKWLRIEVLLDKYRINPMVGVIPNCKDGNLAFQDIDQEFWRKVQSWQEKGWTIAMHGYDHCYVSDKGMQGINPMWKRSEFAGVDLEEQREKVHLGVCILRKHGVNPQYFFAPSHTFDENTLIALREESDIRVISDTIGRYPYKNDDFWFIPQIVGHCVNMPIAGIYTFCFHPNIMDNAAFDSLDYFLRIYGNYFVGFNQIDLTNYGRKRMFDKLLSYFFFSFRRLRGLR